MVFQVVDGVDACLRGVSCQRCGLNTRVQSADEKRESKIEDDLLKECNDLLTGPGCVHSDYHLSVDPGGETSQNVFLLQLKTK